MAVSDRGVTCHRRTLSLLDSMVDISESLACPTESTWSMCGNEFDCAVLYFHWMDPALCKFIIMCAIRGFYLAITHRYIWLYFRVYTYDPLTSSSCCCTCYGKLTVGPMYSNSTKQYSTVFHLWSKHKNVVSEPTM